MKINPKNRVEPENTGWSLEYHMTFACGAKGRKRLREGRAASTSSPARIPRVVRLLALAHHFDALLRSGEIANYAHLARLAGVSRSRVTQIMNLLHLAPDIQEAILDLPLKTKGEIPFSEGHLRPLGAIPEWSNQRRLWSWLCEGKCGMIRQGIQALPSHKE